MSASVEQMQVFYEIAMSIGLSVDLRTMVKATLSTYLKKLNCSSGAVLQYSSTPNGKVAFSTVHSSPRNFGKVEQYEQEINAIFQKSSRDDKELFPFQYRAESGRNITVMSLPDFGLLVLSRTGDNFDDYMLLSVQQLNIKFAHACNACVQGETVKRQAGLITSLLDSIPDLIFYKDRDGVYLGCNPSFAEFIGKMREEIIGKTDYDLFTQEIADFFRENDKIMLKTKQPRRYDEWITYPDGRKILIDTLKTPYRGPSDELIGIMGISRDITERKKAEENLKTQKERLNNILEGTNMGSWEWNVQTGETIFNEKWANIIGFTLNEISPVSIDTWMKFAHPDDLKKSEELLRKHFNGELDYYHFESRMKHKNGHWIWVLDCGKVISRDEDSKPLWMFGTHTDITERKKAEDALLRQERLSAIGELASGVAHDFNNALQIILGGVEMAIVSEKPEELSQYLESIKQSAGDAASRVRQLQRFSQKSQTQKESVPIDINKLAKDVIKETKLFINQYQKKGIHIEIKSDYQAKSNIEGVEGELRACIFNLIKNSAEAMPKGGKMLISTDEYDDNVYVSVADTGSGMDIETQKKIFQPFYSTKGFEPGRGLGMAQVYSTIKDHNGDIYIKKSELGKGTVIEFALPISKKESILVKKEKDYAGTANILWVDDEEMIRTLGEKIVKKLGYTVDVAANGSEALEFLVKGNKYDLIITDIGMPGMSGWQLAEEIKSRGYSPRIAVLTGWGAEVSQEQKNRYNVGYVLGKPVKIKDLKALIGEVLQMKNISGEEDVNK